jgi:hypothetical protein
VAQTGRCFQPHGINGSTQDHARAMEDRDQTRGHCHVNELGRTFSSLFPEFGARQQARPAFSDLASPTPAPYHDAFT